MFPAIAIMTLTGFLAGLCLTRLARSMPASGEALIEAIDRELPQTQCAQCGYPGCRPYAEAIAAGSASIDQCPPGGDTTLRALARLLGHDRPGFDAASSARPMPQIARIAEDDCIGCARCLDACPVDAIVGAHQFVHTVLTDECTGCGLCMSPCPVDCIELVPTASQPVTN